MNHKTAIATCREVPDLDEDGPALLAALAQVGVEAQPAIWDDPTVDWSAFDAVILRNTWDYAERRDDFLSWIDAAATQTRVLNPPDVVHWNTDKHYLRDLSAKGAPIVDTFWWKENTSLPDWPDFVVKPTVSAGCKDTARFTPGELPDAQALAAGIRASGRDVMVQPYLDAVDDHGESALLFFGGEFSHAIRKGPLLQRGAGLETALFRPETIDPRTPSKAEHQAADAILAALPFDPRSLLYIRVDLIPGSDGAPRLLELELTEPSIFLGFDDRAADRFAQALLRMLG